MSDQYPIHPDYGNWAGDPGYMPKRDEDTMAAALSPFGWTCGPEFWQRYHTDPWVFHLANAVEKLTERLAAEQEPAS